MPRKNNPLPSKRIQLPARDRSAKKTFPTKIAAEAAIKYIQIYNPDISLSAYQSPQDGLWRLTSKLQPEG